MAFEDLPELTENQIQDIAFGRMNKNVFPVVEDAELTRNGNVTWPIYAVGRGKIDEEEVVFFGKTYFGNRREGRMTDVQTWEIVGNMYNQVEYRALTVTHTERPSILRE